MQPVELRDVVCYELACVNAHGEALPVEEGLKRLDGAVGHDYWHDKTVDGMVEA